MKDGKPETVREVLDLIDEVLDGLDESAAYGVVNVLSALRGPDNGDEGLKTTTTAVIRAKAFPKLHKRKGDYGGFGPDYNRVGQLSIPGSTVQVPDRFEYDHFTKHALSAAYALRLSVASLDAEPVQ